MNLLWLRKRRLRTVWRVEKKNKIFFLVGTAHFSPYSFKRSLLKIIKNVNTVAFEGPLDPASMAKVSEYGKHGEQVPSLYDALRLESIQEINRQLHIKFKAQESAKELFTNLYQHRNSDLLRDLIQGVKPWFGFFTIWSTILGWKYSMDLEAYDLAVSLKKDIQYLETIDDQLVSLDGIPFERIVDFLNRIKQWESYKRDFLNTFLSGDLERFASITKDFPTRCESIITKRDPVFFEKIKNLSERGVFVAFIGFIHILGLTRMLLDDGFKVIQQEI